MGRVWRSVRRLARDSALARVVTAYALFSVCEYGVWIAVLVYAFDHGGATASGLVALAELLPAAATAPLFALAVDRYAPSAVLAVGYVGQATGAAVMAVGAAAGAPPLVVYAGAVACSACVSCTRPAQAALLPNLTRDVGGLTAANAVFGWLESLCIVAAGLGVAAGLATVGIGAVLAVAVVALGVAAWLVAPLRSFPLAASDDLAGAWRDVRDGFGVVRATPAARLLVAMLALEFVVIGALDILFVVVAVDALHESTTWVGYLNSAYGVGGAAFAAVAATLSGRRLAPVLAAAAVVLGVALGAAGWTTRPVAVLGLLAIVGGARSTFDIAARSLLQRTVPPALVARVFGIAEAVSMAGLGVGSVLVPGLVGLGGIRLALVGCAAILPVALAVAWRLVARLDQHAVVPIVEIGLLRSVELFRDLPAPALEGLARALRPVHVDAGHALIREGEPGDCYFAIVEGHVDVVRRGRHVVRLGRGAGFGEIALLRDVLRTATVTAVTPLFVYELAREPFLVAVQAHPRTRSRAFDVADAIAVRDAGW